MENNKSKSATLEKAWFSMGCFWGPDHLFSKLPGVKSTRVGYTGGTTKNPIYHDLGDHTETVEIIYDSNKITYETLLEYFWQNHDPTSQQITQYKSIIFYHTSHQRDLAQQSLEEEQDKQTKPILTEMRPAETFYEAEEYHQHYFQKHGTH